MVVKHINNTKCAWMGVKIIVVEKFFCGLELTLPLANVVIFSFISRLCCHWLTSDIVYFQGTLPLAKLCAMVTMQRKGEQNTQSFSVALSSLVPESDENTNNTQVQYYRIYS